MQDQICHVYLLLLLGIYKTNILSSIIGALGVILCGTYSLWLYNRIIFGNLKITSNLLEELNVENIFSLMWIHFLVGIYL